MFTLRKTFSLAMIGIIYGLNGCHQATSEVEVKNTANVQNSVDDWNEGTSATFDMPNGPCSESEASYVDARVIGNNLAYRKCWSSKTKKFATEVYLNKELSVYYFIPTLPPNDGNDRYSPALEKVIKETLAQSGPEVLNDHENIGRIRFIDLNFDGHLDLLIYKGIYEDPIWIDDVDYEEYKMWAEMDKGDKKLNPQKFYDGYLWNDETKRFAYEKELHSIASPVVDENNKVIRMMRNVKRWPTGGKGPNLSESEHGSSNNPHWLRYQREFVELKYVSDHYDFSSAVTFVSCGDYVEEIGNLSIVGEHSDNTECVYSEYAYDDDIERRIKSYVPVEELSPKWTEYLKSLGPRI